MYNLDSHNWLLLSYKTKILYFYRLFNTILTYTLLQTFYACIIRLNTWVTNNKMKIIGKFEVDDGIILRR